MKHENLKDDMSVEAEILIETLEIIKNWGIKYIPSKSAPDDITRKDIPSKAVLLKDLEEKTVSFCRLCLLHEGRNNAVFGEGNPDSVLMFVGEAPGREEDIKGRPFVGPAGQLLTKIIESIGLKREEVYIANVLKCRPPDNRDPLLEEVSVCRPFLMKQIEIIRPKIICPLGKFATQFFLGDQISISKIRGRFFDFNGIILMPTYHPSFLLRNPSMKRPVWEDMKKLKIEYERVLVEEIE